MTVLTYKDLIVWQKAMDLVIEIYRQTKKLPREELYGLSSQMKRAAVSIPSNIAEGKMRGSKKDYRHFLLNSFASGAELETQIELALRLNFFQTDNVQKMRSLLEEVMKMLNVLVMKLGT